MNQFIQYLVEICKKDNLTLSEVSEKINFTNDELLLSSIFQIKFPDYNFYLKEFTDFISSFDFPKNVTLDFDKTFEKEDYILNIKFSNLKQLYEKITKLNESISIVSKSKIDFFDHNNFFKLDKL